MVTLSSRGLRRPIPLLIFIAVLVIFAFHGSTSFNSILGYGMSGHGAHESNGTSADLVQQGAPTPAGARYSKMLVVPRMKNEDVSWISTSFPNDSNIRSTVYTVDDPSASFHPPQNKGHEVMTYLTYIIDHYNNLSDVTVFMHSHRYSWHTNELLSHDAVETVTRLSTERVQREGYMNLRCHWDHGCPSWLQPGTASEDVNKKEEILLAQSWAELFPSEPVPNVLAQPCCAQFAVSRESLRSLSRERYIFFQDWLLHTTLTDEMSGRVWEYLWQYIFTGQHVLCPKENVCYCDGFGLCFGGERQYAEWWDKMWLKRREEEQLKEWHVKNDAITMAKEEGKTDDLALLEIPVDGGDSDLEGRIAELHLWLEKEKWTATIRGEDPKERALEAGRAWQDGDGF